MLSFILFIPFCLFISSELAVEVVPPGVVQCIACWLCTEALPSTPFFCPFVFIEWTHVEWPPCPGPVLSFGEYTLCLRDATASAYTEDTSSEVSVATHFATQLIYSRIFIREKVFFVFLYNRFIPKIDILKMWFNYKGEYSLKNKSCDIFLFLSQYLYVQFV